MRPGGEPRVGDMAMSREARRLRGGTTIREQLRTQQRHDERLFYCLAGPHSRRGLREAKHSQASRRGHGTTETRPNRDPRPPPLALVRVAAITEPFQLFLSRSRPSSNGCVPRDSRSS